MIWFSKGLLYQNEYAISVKMRETEHMFRTNVLLKLYSLSKEVSREKRTYVRNMRSERIAFKHVLCYYVKQLDEAFVDKIGFVQG